MIDRPDGCAPIHKDFNKLKTWANAKPMEFIQGKCQALHWRRNTPCTRTGCRLNAWKAVLQRRPGGHGRQWINSETTMCLCIREVNSILRYIWKSIFSRLLEVIHPLPRQLRPHLECCVQSCTLWSKRHGHTGIGPIKDHRYDPWSISHRMRGWDYSAWKRDRRNYMCLSAWWRGGSRKKVSMMEPNSFLWQGKMQLAPAEIHNKFLYKYIKIYITMYTIYKTYISIYYITYNM